MKITLIEPPRYYAPTSAISTVVIPPLGPAYIAGALERAGHEVTVVDALAQGMTTFTPFHNIYIRGLSLKDIASQIPKDVGMIGVSCMFSAQWLIVRDLVRRLKKEFPDTPIVLGGEHGTGMPDLSMEQAPLDYIVTGEGEETAVELAAKLADGQKPLDITGTIARDGNTWRTNLRRDRVRDVDSIARPAWHLYDVEAYIDFNQPHGASRGRFMPMLFTRGCPFQCTFCTSAQMWTQRWVARDVKQVVDEMQTYMKRYNVTDFHFEDLTAIVKKDVIVDFCKEIIERGLKVSFQLPSGTRSEAVDAEAARWMKQAGCHEFSFAPEAGDPRILKAIKKQVSLPELFISAKAAMDAGINVGGFFIVGFPEDSYLSILRTLKVIAKCAIVGFSSVNVNPYSPQPNTASFRALRDKGFFPEFDDDYFLDLFRFQEIFAAKVSYNERFRPWQITLFVILGFATFYIFYFASRPWRILKVFKDLFRRTSSD